MSELEELKKKRDGIHSQILSLMKELKIEEIEQCSVGDYFYDEDEDYDNYRVEILSKIISLDKKYGFVNLLEIKYYRNYGSADRMEFDEICQIKGKKISYAEKEKILNKWFEMANLGDF